MHIAIAKALECFRAIDRHRSPSIAIDRSSRIVECTCASARDANANDNLVCVRSRSRTRIKGYKDIYTPRTIAPRASRRRVGRDSNDCTARDYTRRSNRTGGVTYDVGRGLDVRARARVVNNGDEWGETRGDLYV